MDIHKILNELHTERQCLDDAIAALERMATTGQQRRGRPPKWLAEVRKSLSASGSNGADAGLRKNALGRAEASDYNGMDGQQQGNPNQD